MQYHLVFVAMDLTVGKLTRLVCVYLPLGIIHSDKDISLLLLWRPLYYWMGWVFGGAHSLELIAHVSLLGFLQFLELPVYIIHGDKRPGGVFAVADDLETNCFGWEPHCCM